MNQHDLCRQCTKRQDCGQLYKQLGKNEGPSIVGKVVLAFLLPLVVFIISLAFFEKIFSAVISDGQIQSAFSLGSSLLLTLICIFLTGQISEKLRQLKQIGISRK